MDVLAPGRRVVRATALIPLERLVLTGLQQANLAIDTAYGSDLGYGVEAHEFNGAKGGLQQVQRLMIGSVAPPRRSA